MRAAFTTGPVLRQPPAVENALVATATLAVLRTLAGTLEAIRELETALDAHFEQHRTPRSCAVSPDSV